MNAKQLCKRLSCRNRGNRYWTSRGVKIGVGSWDRPRSRKSAELPFLYCEVERCEQLSCEHGSVEPRIQVRLHPAQCFSLLAYVKPELLEVSIVRFGQLERFIEREYTATAPLRAGTRQKEQYCDEREDHS